MNSLVKSLIFPLLESEQKGVALIPGGFKPPTIGHFVLVDEVAQNPNFDKVIVLIGHKIRDGVTKEESLAVWDIYKKYLPSNVEIKISDNSSPIADISSLIKNNPDTYFYPVVGIRGEMDLGDIKRFDSLEGKYPNFKTIVIKSNEGKDRVSGTKTRAALIGGEKETFQSYLPTELSQEEKDGIWSILTKTPLNEIKYAEPSKFDYPKQLKSLTEFMLDKGMNIRPLPKVKFIEDDIENARNFFGKTAYYDRNQRVIVLYTMDRHPKDIMRSFAHEMIHHMQNCENRLNGISTQNTNEEGDLPKIEREAYEKGNMTFRNWTDTITEWIVDTSKYNYTPKLSNKIFSQLHELKVNEITLNPNNAVEIYGDLFSGEFKVGNIEYIYSIKNIPSPYKDGELFYNIQFDEKNNNKSSNEPTGNARENYIKILSTMYKILLDFVEQEKPEYIGISSLDKSGYRNIYNNLTKTNKLPGYSRKDAGLDFVSKSGEKGKFIVLKKSIIEDRIDCDKCGHSWPIVTGGKDLYICHDCRHDNTPKPLNEEKEEDNGTLLYKSIFKPDINILVAFGNYENYKILKPLFNKYGYGFYSPEDKTIILNGERFINSNLDENDLKFVEAHEITHLLLGHTGPYSEEDEMDADLGAYILLKNKKLSTDRLVNEFENRHGIPFTEELLERVKNRL
jgi:Zn-dependent peptidase ImmA (M78 family)